MAFSLSHFKTRTRPTPDWIIPNLLKRRNTAFIIGMPKRACKSWLLLAMAFDLSEGQPLWNVHHTKGGAVFPIARPMRVIYFTQEDTEDDIHDRLEKHLARRPTNDHLFIVPKNLQNMLDGMVGFNKIKAEIDGVVKEYGPVDVVIFDPMRRMHNKEENSSDSMVAIWKQLDELQQRYNCSVMFAHHTVKPGKGLMDAVDMTSPNAARGSSDLFGGGDAFINVVERHLRGNKSNQYRYLTLHFESKRSKAISPVNLAVSFHDASVTFQGYSGAKDNTDKDVLPEVAEGLPIQ